MEALQKIWCWFCHKTVCEISIETRFAGVAICSDCMKKLVPLKKETEDANA